MRSPRPRSISLTAVAVLTACFCASPLRSQDDATTEAAEEAEVSPQPPRGRPLKLDISRRALKNFLTDEVALIPYQDKDGEAKELQDTFMIGAVKSAHAAFWDPVSCRLLGALNLKDSTEPVEAPEGETEEEPPTPYTLLASGAHPLNGSKGTFEKPKYFGFRIVGGRPEFLYTFGGLQIEEQVWLEDDGLVLKTRYVVKGSKSGYTLTYPAGWKERCEASIGEWKENQLTVPGDAEGELILTFHLDKRETKSPEEN